jgi:Zn finger protein HypA/HybF involved in hydrogenase expression
LALDPELFDDKCDRQRRGGLPNRSFSEGPRGSEVPLPELDKFDRWLSDQRKLYRASLEHALEALRECEAVERAVCLPFGENIYDTDPREARKAMARAISKATEILVDEAQGVHKAVCKNCNAAVKRSKGKRIKAGRCPDCHEYWVLSGYAKDRPGPTEGAFACFNCKEPLEEERKTGECARCRKHRHRHDLPYPHKQEQATG